MNSDFEKVSAIPFIKKVPIIFYKKHVSEQSAT